MYLLTLSISISISFLNVRSNISCYLKKKIAGNLLKMRKTHPESLYNIWNFLELNPVVISRIAQCARQGNNSHANRCSQFLLHKLFNKLDAKLKFPISAIWSQTVCTSNCFLLFKTMHNSLCMIKIQSLISVPVSSI